ncbi:uracil-DNA glycosylase [Magnaporthiopsis poae ATCC 64411]|uniref:Uracil-DNA glycosylase n=1 Tax=Magnaporthiopsis poae (strain ATCC 64411 / 73-15) TaxID=644358 RepID=A0A0C4E3X9_MAGP6|nr:uracil-DNA glycosylase [Magnaporthiopsis poae ATCC 64411]
MQPPLPAWQLGRPLLLETESELACDRARPALASVPEKPRLGTEPDSDHNLHHSRDYFLHISALFEQRYRRHLYLLARFCRVSLARHSASRIYHLSTVKLAYPSVMASLKRKGGSLAAGGTKKLKNTSITSFFEAPKAGAGAAGAPEPPRVKFNKKEWVKSLTDEQKELLKLEIDTLDESWLALLQDEIKAPYFLNLKRFLNREAAANKTVFPPRQDIYSWSRHTPFHSVKVVILGQDPYHNLNQAHGLAFSVRPPTKAPPSLVNMYKCLENDYPSFKRPPNSGGLLTPWAQRGVLMLNTCLTVRAHEANSHADQGWKKFTQCVIKLVAARRSRGVVFMAWGAPAAKTVRDAGVNASLHLVLKAVHPSPLSAHLGYLKCGHYRLANEWLIQRYGQDAEIDWALVPGNSTLEAKAPAAAAAAAAAEAEGDVDEDAEEAEREAAAMAESVKVEVKKGDVKGNEENEDPAKA